MIPKEPIRFIIVGAMNTCLGMGLLFGLYNFLEFGYWLSSALSYILASIFSYFMNKRFTFQHQEASAKSFVRFWINIAGCYLVAYMLAKPLVFSICEKAWPGMEVKYIENIALLTGSCLFTLLNFFGQKLFVFRRLQKEGDSPFG